MLQVNQALLKEDDDLLRQTFLSVFKEHHPQVPARTSLPVVFCLHCPASCHFFVGLLCISLWHVPCRWGLGVNQGSGIIYFAAVAGSTRRRAAAQPPPHRMAPIPSLLRGCPARLLRPTTLPRNPPHARPQLANKVDVIFALAQAWCLSESDSDFELLEKRLEALTPDESILVRGAVCRRCLHHCGLACGTRSQCHPVAACRRRWSSLSPSCMAATSVAVPQVASAFSQLLNLHNVTEESITARVEKASSCRCTACLEGAPVPCVLAAATLVSGKLHYACNVVSWPLGHPMRCPAVLLPQSGGTLV